jgi:hypothetical protein
MERLTSARPLEWPLARSSPNRRGPSLRFPAALSALSSAVRAIDLGERPVVINTVPNYDLCSGLTAEPGQRGTEGNEGCSSMEGSSPPSICGRDPHLRRRSARRHPCSAGRSGPTMVEPRLSVEQMSLWSAVRCKNGNWTNRTEAARRRSRFSVRKWGLLGA